MRFKILLLLLFCPLLQSVQDRRPCAPYISGDTFRNSCDHLFDETTKKIKFHKIKKGDTVFVKTDLLKEFFLKIHPLIQNPYVLITHNSDFGVPGIFYPMLNDPKILAWFGQNVENYTHPKLHPIPIGFANRYWSSNKIEILDGMKKQTFFKDHLIYMNFTVNPLYAERNLVFEQFKDEPFCLLALKVSFETYLVNAASSKFVLSPRGNGLDCHRTWEVLWMGSYPIFKTSASDSLYEDLPVIIVKDWAEVTEEFLCKKYVEMLLQEYNLEKLYFPYWEKWIHSFKNI